MFEVPQTRTPSNSVSFGPILGITKDIIGLEAIMTMLNEPKTNPITEFVIPLLAASIGKKGAIIDKASIDVKLMKDKQINTRC